MAAVQEGSAALCGLAGEQLGVVPGTALQEFRAALYRVAEAAEVEGVPGGETAAGAVRLLPDHHQTGQVGEIVQNCFDFLHDWYSSVVKSICLQ